MPLWGAHFDIEDMQDVRQVLTFIRCLLEGLSFLHANRIAHRDIYDGNLVVSCYRPDRDLKKFREDLHELRRRPDIRYALMDYDQSIQLPLDVSVKHCRRPSDEAWMGWDLYKPLDVWLGETLYNPFAFDVGTLGNLFRAHLFEAVPMVPALAALFDGMTTHVVSRRFSAEEALDFFRNNVDSPPQEVLETQVTLGINYDMMLRPELYWSKLAPPAQAHWSRFRAPPLPRWWHFVNWLNRFRVGARVVEFVWWILGI
uniref:Oligoribonuclease (EC) n=1 Tax=Ganoderma boninense TaxID=34458 RepID=A0A5K1K0R8_9APHY|nr:Oligoribonuclease (EC [Ganoderma boninense]